MRRKSFAFTPSWKYLNHSNAKHEKQNSYMIRPLKQEYQSFLKHTNNAVTRRGEKTTTTTHVKHPDLFRLIPSERARRLLVHFRRTKSVCWFTWKPTIFFRHTLQPSTALPSSQGLFSQMWFRHVKNKEVKYRESNALRFLYNNTPGLTWNDLTLFRQSAKKVFRREA